MFPSFDGEGEAASLSPSSLPPKPAVSFPKMTISFQRLQIKLRHKPLLSLSLSPLVTNPSSHIPNKLKRKMETKNADHPPPFRRSQRSRPRSFRWIIIGFCFWWREVPHPWWLHLRSKGTTTVLITDDKLLVMCTEYLEEREELIQALHKDRKFFDLPNITQISLLLLLKQILRLHLDLGSEGNLLTERKREH